jgi:hypothetical protein
MLGKMIPALNEAPGSIMTCCSACYFSGFFVFSSALLFAYVSFSAKVFRKSAGFLIHEIDRHSASCA